MIASLGVACTNESRSPVGEDLLPDGILEAGLEVVVLDSFPTAETYTVFPSTRAEADRVVTAKDWPQAPGLESRALFRFSLEAVEALPDDSDLNGATVRFVFAPVPPSPMTFSLVRVDREWKETEATWERATLVEPWNQPGGDFGAEPLAQFTIGGGGPADSVASDSVSVEIPIELVEQWLSGEITNSGLAIIQETPGTKIDFASRGNGGINPNGPTLRVDALLPDGVGALTSILAIEDTFIASSVSRNGSGLLVAGAEPVHRSLVIPDFAGLRDGSTIARAALIMTVKDAVIPADSLEIVANQVLTEFLGEKTILAPASSTSILGLAPITVETQPGDTVVFESTRLTAFVTAWFLNPETNLGVALTLNFEETEFGSVEFHGPGSEPALRPRLRLVVIPPPEIQN